VVEEKKEEGKWAQKKTNPIERLAISTDYQKSVILGDLFLINNIVLDKQHALVSNEDGTERRAGAFKLGRFPSPFDALLSGDFQ